MMPDKLKIVELDNRTADIREKSVNMREERKQQFNFSLDRRRRDFEQGFVTALDMIARGTRDFDHEEPTVPYPAIDSSTVEVD